MKIFKTLVGHADRPVILICDTIRHAGKLWLVPKWIASPKTGYRRPERIISLTDLPHQKSPLPDADFVLNAPLPQVVIDGKANNSEGQFFVVEDAPSIDLLMPHRVH